MGPSGLENILAAGNVKTSPTFARYMVCPQCRLIMSSRRKKAVEIAPNVWIHKACKPVFLRRAIELAKKDAAAAQPPPPPPEVAADVA